MTGLRKVAAISALVSVPVGAASTLLFLTAAGSPRTLYRPELLVEIGSDGALLLRWAALTDMLGYYLLLAPLFIYLYSIHRDHPLALLYTVSGLVYVTAGAAAAVFLSASAPQLIDAYGTAGGSERLVIEATFRALTAGIFQGVWQTLVPIALGIAMIGFGRLIAVNRRPIGNFAFILGVGSLIIAIVRLLGLDPALLDPQGIFLLLALIIPLTLPLWIGFEILGGKL